MASGKGYLEFILSQLDGLEGIRYRAMMGEYLLYCEDRLFGGIYDDRLLVKPVRSALAMLPDAPQELPYEGAKPMLLVENVDDAAHLKALVTAMLPDLPDPKKRK